MFKFLKKLEPIYKLLFTNELLEKEVERSWVDKNKYPSLGKYKSIEEARQALGDEVFLSYFMRKSPITACDLLLFDGLVGNWQNTGEWDYSRICPKLHEKYRKKDISEPVHAIAQSLQIPGRWVVSSKKPDRYFNRVDKKSISDTITKFEALTYVAFPDGLTVVFGEDEVWMTKDERDFLSAEFLNFRRCWEKSELEKLEKDFFILRDSARQKRMEEFCK